MKPAQFDYVRATSAHDAAEVLRRHPDAIPIAGGQTLMPLLNMRLAQPSMVVDIAHAEDLIGVDVRDGWLVIGAATRQLALQHDARLAQSAPLLAKALPWIGHRATRARGTIGGSIAFADPAAELPLIAVTLDARITVLVAGQSQIFAADDFFLGDMMTALPESALLTEIAFRVAAGADPVGTNRVGTGFAEVATRHSDFAYASAAAQIIVADDGTITDAHLAVGAVDGRPQRLGEAAADMIAKTAGPALLDTALADIEATISARDHPTASAAYCRRAAAALLRRAAREAIDEVTRHD